MLSVVTRKTPLSERILLIKKLCKL